MLENTIIEEQNMTLWHVHFVPQRQNQPTVLLTRSPDREVSTSLDDISSSLASSGTHGSPSSRYSLIVESGNLKLAQRQSRAAEEPQKEDHDGSETRDPHLASAKWVGGRTRLETDGAKTV